MISTVPVPLMHEGGLQTVPAAYLAQPPAPSHEPLVPQLAAIMSAHTPRGSFTPLGTGRQTPGAPTWPQLRQGPSHLESQQTPSTQKPLTHYTPSVHMAPGSFLPQLLSRHSRPGTHWAGPVQVEKQ